MKLYPHQIKYLTERNFNKDLLAHEGGTGKSIIGAEWLKTRSEKEALVICPKRIKQKWGKITRAKIMSVEEFVKDPPKTVSALVVDEIDMFASPLFVPKLRSNRSVVLYDFIKKNPQMPILGCSATMIRSTPWNLHTLLCFVGIYIDFKKWRDYFFSLEYRSYLPRPAWLPKKNWRVLIRPVLEKYADIVLLQNCVDYLPPITEEIIKVKTLHFDAKEWEPMKKFVEEHRHEQKNKIKTIKEISKKYRKIVVIAHYREQIDQLYKELKKERETFVIKGGIKEQEKIIQQAQQSDECYFIVQASLSAGYDLDTFSCMIFASMSYRYVDFVQMKFRVRRINSLHPVIFYYILGGKRDTDVYQTILKGRDFDPSFYMKKYVTKIT